MPRMTRKNLQLNLSVFVFAHPIFSRTSPNSIMTINLTCLSKVFALQLKKCFCDKDSYTNVGRTGVFNWIFYIVVLVARTDRAELTGVIPYSRFLISRYPNCSSAKNSILFFSINPNSRHPFSRLICMLRL